MSEARIPASPPSRPLTRSSPSRAAGIAWSSTPHWRRRRVAAGAPVRAGRRARRQPLLHPADGRLGRHAGRRAERADDPALAQFRTSGAKLIWGGEAVAVRHDGRANPNQLLLTPATHPAIAGLRDALVAAHVERFGAGADADLYIGLQLTHSGRFAKPPLHERPEPIAAVAQSAARPPLRQRRAGPHRRRDRPLDRRLRGGGELAAEAGFQFVDVKHCHGYLGTSC